MDLDFDDIVNPLKTANPLKIILFGSYAYGKPTQDSDIDLLVVVDTSKNFHERIQTLRLLLPKDKPIDLIVLTPTEYQKAKSANLLIAEIESRGRVLYG